MKNLFFIFILFFTYSLKAQQITVKDSIRTYVEKMPEFPGGQPELMKFLQKNLRYPPEAREKGIQGRVVTQFIVNEDGTISDVLILRSIGGGCDEEVLRIIGMMPKWDPGIQNGVPVKTYFKLPCTFKLGDENGDSFLNHMNSTPQFKGGAQAYQKFIHKNLHYPKDAKKQHVEGEVKLSFTVDEFGKPGEPKIVSSLSKSCDEEALRLFQLIPSWQPGYTDGKPTSMDAVMVVQFNL